MSHLGEIIRNNRTGSQLDLARQLGVHSKKQIQQSYIARLENGKAFPDKEMLEALSQALSMPYDTLLAALIKDHYGQENRLDIFYPLEKGILTLTELAAWEATESHAETWIVAQEYIDDHFRAFRSAIKAILRRGHKVTFFVSDELRVLIDMYRHEMSIELGRTVDEEEFRYVPLSTIQRALLVNPFVIASESGLSSPSFDAKPMGFQILTDGQGDPHLALSLSAKEARLRYQALRTFLRHERLKAA